MHETLARYLNLDQAQETLSKEAAGQGLEEAEQRFARVARAHPEERDAIMQGRGKSVREEVQQALLKLATQAAVAALQQDAQLGPQVEIARRAMAAEGADEEETAHLLALILLEEAFTGEDTPDTFDRAYVEEGLAGVPSLAALTPERLEALREDFEGTAPEGWTRIHAMAAGAVLEAAFSDGLQPINTEHLEGAIESLREKLGAAKAAQGREALRRFLDVLAQAKLLGPLRQARLLEVLQRAEQSEARGPSH